MRRARRLRHLVLLTFVTLLGAACAAGGGSDVAATVGDREITVAELEEEVDRRAESSDLASELAGDESGDMAASLRANVLTEMIRSEIVDLAAEDRGVDVSEGDIAEQRSEVIESVGGEEQFQQILEESNVSDEQLQTTLRDRAVQSAIGQELASEVTSEDVRSAFEADPQGQYGEQVAVRHILTETEAQAQDAIDRIEGGEEFAAVAEDVSIDPGSAATGGDLGTVSRGATVPEFEEAAFNAEVGELVGPVESEFGFHVIEVTEQIEGSELGDVRGELRDQLETVAASQAFTTYITEFVEDLEIEVDEQFGRWDPDTLSVVVEPTATPSGPPVPPATAPPAGDAPTPAPAPTG